MFEECKKCNITDNGVAIIADACISSKSIVPVQQTIRVCAAIGDLVCNGPCYQCPEACVKTIRTECHVTHVVHSDVRFRNGNRIFREL